MFLMYLFTMFRCGLSSMHCSTFSWILIAVHTSGSYYRGVQAAFTLVKDAAKAKEKPQNPQGRLPIGEAAAAGRLIEV